MTWVKLDDHFDENDKQLRASDAAVRVWVCSMAWCARQKEPVGFMTTAQAIRFVRGLGKKPAVIDELVSLNAWEVVEDGYLVHDFDVYLPKSSTDRVRAWRAAKRGTPNPEPTSPPPNGTASNADVTRYTSVAQREVTPAATPEQPPGNADETACNSRAWARSRGGIPVSRIPYTQSPPTSDSLPLPPRWLPPDSGLPDGVRERAQELEQACSEFLNRAIRPGDEGLVLRKWAAMRRDGEFVAVAEIVNLARWLMSQPTKNGLPPGTLLYIEAQVMALARAPWSGPGPAPARPGRSRESANARVDALLAEAEADESPPLDLHAAAGGAS